MGRKKRDLFLYAFPFLFMRLEGIKSRNIMRYFAKLLRGSRDTHLHPTKHAGATIVIFYAHCVRVLREIQIWCIWNMPSATRSNSLANS
jgi:hypothetical protein